MKLAAPLLLLLLAACNDSSKEKNTPSDTTGKSTPATDTIVPAVTSLVSEVTLKLQEDKGEKWTIVDDRIANWQKDQFDYFIAPQRKTNPDYPYITQGDYDGDGKRDIAALVTDSLKKKFNIRIFLGSGNSWTWEEDIMVESALSTTPPAEIDGMEGENTKKVKLKYDAINVEYFESAAFLVYWDGKRFNRLQTAD